MTTPWRRHVSAPRAVPAGARGARGAFADRLTALEDPLNGGEEFAGGQNDGKVLEWTTNANDLPMVIAQCVGLMVPFLVHF